MTLQDGQNHNCGCKPDDPHCCSCCSLWLASHFWSIFMMIEICGFFAINTYSWNSSESIIRYIAWSLILSVLPCIAYLYALYQCNYYLMYWIRISIWCQYAYCLLFLIAAFSGTAYDVYDGDSGYIGLVVFCCFVHFFFMIWADNVFTKTQVWAKYFKKGGIYPPIQTIWDFEKNYVCCMNGFCSCCSC